MRAPILDVMAAPAVPAKFVGDTTHEKLVSAAAFVIVMSVPVFISVFALSVVSHFVMAYRGD